jgi:Ca-activated chloride channel homolog
VEVKKKIPNIKTDIQGNYKLNLPAATYTFIISAIGYDAKELSVKIAENQQKIPNVALSRIFNDAEINSLTAAEYSEFFTQVNLIRPRGEFEREIAITERIKMSKRAILNRIRAESMGSEVEQATVYKSAPAPPAELKMPNPKAVNTEDYSAIVENGYKNPQKEPLSTFSIDVDKASYSNVRRCIERQRLPPEGSVRIEELVNYFEYD